MDANKILQANILDLIFDGRNKDYGAYDLRKTYNQRVLTALSIVFGVLVCFIVINLSHGKTRNTKLVEKNTTFILTNVKTKPIAIKKDQPKEKRHDKTLFKKINKNPIKLELKSYTKPKIVPDEFFDVKKNVKKIDELANSRISNIEQVGKNTNIAAPNIKVNGPGGTGIGNPDPSDHFGGNGTGEKSGGDIATIVQKEAQYSTGKEGWINYLHRSLRSDVPTENGAPAGRNYTVIVAFIVDIDGTISNVVAENDPGYGTAIEAVRAIRNSGKWIPAEQNGKKVKYRQRQQITFIVEQD